MSFFRSTIANTISAINVGYLNNKRYLVLPTTTYSRQLLLRLVDVGVLSHIEQYHTSGTIKQLQYVKYMKFYKIHLLYKEMRPVVSKLILISKESQVVSIRCNVLRKFITTRRGILLISTPQGILTDREALERTLGGIVLLWILF